jgi:hypothetical protein
LLAAIDVVDGARSRLMAQLRRSELSAQCPLSGSIGSEILIASISHFDP